MQDLNDLRFFAEVVEQNGFAAAARKLGMPRSRLSRRIGLLEERLGVRLVHRCGTADRSLARLGAEGRHHSCGISIKKRIAAFGAGASGFFGKGICPIRAPWWKNAGMKRKTTADHAGAISPLRRRASGAKGVGAFVRFQAGGQGSRVPRMGATEVTGRELPVCFRV